MPLSPRIGCVVLLLLQAASTFGRLYFNGGNYGSQQGTPATSNVPSPTALDLPNVLAVEQIAAYHHTLVLGAGGFVFAFGYGESYQLCTGNATNVTTPNGHIRFQGGPGVAIRSVAAGAYHSLFVGADGRVHVCGSNQFGQLGLSTLPNFTAPTPTPIQFFDGVNVSARSVVAGDATSFVLTDDGSVYAFGNNLEGALGLPAAGSIVWDPQRVIVPDGLGVSKVSTKLHSTLFLTVTGRIFASGRNDYGQLGIRSFAQASTLVPAANLSAVYRDIAAGYRHSFVVSECGDAWATGSNDYTQLTLPESQTRANSFRPVMAPIPELGLTRFPPVKGAWAGDDFSVFLTDEGRVLTVGLNDRGQLAAGFVSVSPPFKGPGMTLVAFDNDPSLTIKSLAAGYDYVGYIPGSVDLLCHSLPTTVALALTSSLSTDGSLLSGDDSAASSSDPLLTILPVIIVVVLLASGVVTVGIMIMLRRRRQAAASKVRPMTPALNELPTPLPPSSMDSFPKVQVAAAGDGPPVVVGVKSSIGQYRRISSVVVSPSSDTTASPSQSGSVASSTSGATGYNFSPARLNNSQSTSASPRTVLVQQQSSSTAAGGSRSPRFGGDTTLTVPGSAEHTPRNPPTLNGSKTLSGWEVDYRTLRIGVEIGAGAFGTVYLAEWRGSDVVVKQSTATSKKSTAAFLKEVQQMERLRPHPNVVGLLGVCVDPSSPFCIVCEFVDGGSLYDLTRALTRELTLPMAVSILKDVAAGMSHIHKEKIMHADLAARNILLSRKANGVLVGKVSDFGLSHALDGEQSVYTATYGAHIPVRWTAPEILLHGAWSFAGDVWSFGCVVYETLQREDPFESQSIAQVIHGVCYGSVRLARPTIIKHPDSVYHLMMSCFKEAKERPTFDELYNSLVQIRRDLRAESALRQGPLTGPEWGLHSLDSEDSRASSQQSDDSDEGEDGAYLAAAMVDSSSTGSAPPSSSGVLAVPSQQQLQQQPGRPSSTALAPSSTAGTSLSSGAASASARSSSRTPGGDGSAALGRSTGGTVYTAVPREQYVDGNKHGYLDQFGDLSLAASEETTAGGYLTSDEALYDME